jgi:hypothetical protein
MLVEHVEEAALLGHQAAEHGVLGVQQRRGRILTHRIIDPALRHARLTSNLAGHDSHGVLCVQKYLEWIDEGMLKPNQHASIVFDAGSVVVDGNLGFGQTGHRRRADARAMLRAAAASVGVADPGWP